MRIFSVFFLLILWPLTATAQQSTTLRDQLTTALKQNDSVTALAKASALYEVSETENNAEAAGFAAFAKASILEMQSEPLAAAKAYRQCSHQYEKVKSEAESIQCEYKEALMLISGYKKGKAVDTLKSAAKRLEAINQSNSALASQVYLRLAEETLPGKLDRERGANTKRLKAAQYAQQSMTALMAIGQDKSPHGFSALYLRALALEDAQAFDEAIPVYKNAIELYKALPNQSDDTLQDLEARLSVAEFSAEKESSGKKNTSNRFTVLDKTGAEIELEIKKRRSIKFPRLGNNQLVDGAHITAKIKLASDGHVETVKILKSSPTKDFGEAFEKAVKKWEFIPTTDISPDEIPPFEYDMVFYVSRR